MSLEILSPIDHYGKKTQRYDEEYSGTMYSNHMVDETASITHTYIAQKNGETGVEFKTITGSPSVHYVDKASHILYGYRKNKNGDNVRTDKIMAIRYKNHTNQPTEEWAGTPILEYGLTADEIILNGRSNTTFVSNNIQMRNVPFTRDFDTFLALKGNRMYKIHKDELPLPVYKEVSFNNLSNIPFKYEGTLFDGGHHNGLNKYTAEIDIGELMDGFKAAGGEYFDLCFNFVINAEAKYGVQNCYFHVRNNNYWGFGREMTKHVFNSGYTQFTFDGAQILKTPTTPSAPVTSWKTSKLMVTIYSAERIGMKGSPFALADQGESFPLDVHELFHLTLRK